VQFHRTIKWLFSISLEYLHFISCGNIYTLYFIGVQSTVDNRKLQGTFLPWFFLMLIERETTCYLGLNLAKAFTEMLRLLVTSEGRLRYDSSLQRN